MVQKTFAFLSREISSIHKAAYLLGVCALISQLLGLFRDRLFAGTFGAGSDLDIYYAAFRIPDFLFATIASLVSLSVIIPLLLEKQSRDKEESRIFIASITTSFLVMISGVSILLYIGAPIILPYLFPGFSSAQIAESLLPMTRILLLSPILLGLSNIIASVTQTARRFLIYALCPIVYNLGIIIGVLFFYPLWGITGLVYGVLLGAFLHLALQLPFFYSEGYALFGLFPKQFAIIRSVVSISFPRTLSMASYEIAEFFLISFASLLASGSISVFTFSWNLQSVPLGIIGVSYAVASFPSLSRNFLEKKFDVFASSALETARSIVFWSVPISVLFIILRAHIVRILLGSGSFSWADTRLTAACFAVFSVSLLFQNLTTFFVRVHYAQGKTMRPFLINLGSAIGIIIGGKLLVMLFLSSLFIHDFFESLLRLQGVPGIEVLALPLAFSVGACITALLHWIVLYRQFKEFRKPFLLSLLHIVSASIIAGVSAYGTLFMLSGASIGGTLLNVFFQGALAGTAGIVAYVCVLTILKNEELLHMRIALSQKIPHLKLIFPEQEKM